VTVCHSRQSAAFILPSSLEPHTTSITCLQQDIPELASAAAAAHPSVECVVAEPIGIDALMAQLIEHRVQAAEAEGSAVARPVSNAAAAQ
jgi:hypothetical protein